MTWRKVTSGGAADSDSGLAGPAEPGPRAPGGWQGPSSPSPRQAPGPAFALRAVPLPMPVPTLTGLLDYLRRPTFKLARKPRQGPWALRVTQGKGTLIAIALATVPWWAEVRCHSGIDHGDGASSLGSCMELGGAAADMLRSGHGPAH